MRKMQKDSVIELVNLLKKAQEHVKNLLDQQAYASVLDLLQQCQEVAIQIGTTIEQTEGEGFPTVKKLEEYCELIFQVFEMVQGYTEQTVVIEGVCKPDADVICGTMDRLLLEIEESIQKDIEVRKEVVFLPYKASMWDSLESVWMAADADPDCDAYVVPIPYFDKNPDGSAKEMHYEGDLYPDYVPITHYDDYNIEQRHPDMIYIHNPYDEANYVTSVHSMFYAKRLKELTDCLVYIPYFVLAEIDPSDKMAIKNMEHFAMLPGVLHAHKVIVQSENMRQIYIDVLTKYVGEQTRPYWEKKIFGTGSPKLDKIRNARREDIEIPNEWLGIIQKSDGTWKKIIFYNTSVTALLENEERMLTKMQDVFETFEKCKDEVALLWRPHPLIKATIESMRPHLWEGYRKLVEEYKEAGWGIYDDTSDMDRAILLSDGYYGDSSSLICLCQSINKPVLLQACHVKTSDKIDGVGKNLFEREVIMQIDDAVHVEGDIFYLAKDINLLCKIECISGKNVIVTSCPEEKISARSMFLRIFSWNNKLIVVPKKSKAIWVYETEKDKWNEQLVCKEKEQFLEAFLHENNLILFEKRLSKVWVVDMYTNTIKTIMIKREVDDESFCATDYAKVQSTVYISNSINSAILKYDMLTQKVSWIKMEEGKGGYDAIEWDGEKLWCLSKSEKCLGVYADTIKRKVYDIPNELAEKEGIFWGMFFENEKFVFPGDLVTCVFQKNKETEYCWTSCKDTYLHYAKSDESSIFKQRMDGTLVEEICCLNSASYYCCTERKELESIFEIQGMHMSEEIFASVFVENNIASLLEYLIAIKGNRR